MRVGLGLFENGQLHFVRLIDAVEYEQSQYAMKALHQFSGYRERYNIVLENFQDFEMTLQRLLEEFIESSWISWVRSDAALLEIKRRLLNLFSSIRTYHDHTEKAFKHLHGESSPIYQQYVNARRTEYDNNFSYRLIEYLRNSAQHRAMPIESVSFKSLLIHENTDRTGSTKQINHSITALCNRDELLQDDRLKASLRKEIAEIPSTFDITPHIRAIKESILRINRVVVINELPRVLPHAEFLLTLVTPISDRQGEPCILHLDNVDEYGNGEVPVEHLPLHMAVHIIELSSAKKSADELGMLA